MKKFNFMFFVLLVFIIISLPAFSQDKGATNVIVPGVDSLLRGLPIAMYDHTELTGDNKYLYLCGVITEREYLMENSRAPGLTGIVDRLFTPIFYKFSYENGRLNYLWQKKYNTGEVNKYNPEKPFEGVSFKYVGVQNCVNGTMYQNSTGGFDIVSSVLNYTDSIAKLLLLSFDSDGSLILKKENIDSMLILHDYSSKKTYYFCPTYIRTKDNKIYYLFQNNDYDGYKNKDPLNLYEGCWVALEFDSLGNYIKKHKLFSVRDLANNDKNFMPRLGHNVYSSENDITFSDVQDNIYILSHIRYDRTVPNSKWRLVRIYYDNLLIKLNKNLGTEFYFFEKDVNPDSTRDVQAMGAAVDKNADILISFKSFDNWIYFETVLQEMKENGLIEEDVDEFNIYGKYDIPRRDTLYHLTKVSGETGEILGIKNIDIGGRILSMKVAATRDGNTYIYGSRYPRNSYLAKIDDDLNIEWITTEDIAIADTLSDFIDLEPGHFALVGLLRREDFREPLIIEFSDNSSISDEQKRVNIIQYPNPAVEQVTINGLLDYTGDVSISIIDINGSKLKTFNTYSSDLFTYTFAVNELPVGSYYVLIQYDNQNIIDKLVITR